MNGIETPFPAKAKLTPTENGIDEDLPCLEQWLTEGDEGNLLREAEKTVEEKYSVGETVTVAFYSDDGMAADDYDIIGVVEGDD
ncbi:hypothetical protein [Haloarcula amylovorans]|uniref:hypothetical protein n=1 Tax=Haloarcula amylovorans TaxID=2562280 RepID=UPI001075CFD0|nr:hypothetical protein [Halomicroarcula amylolytica]